MSTLSKLLLSAQTFCFIYLLLFTDIKAEGYLFAIQLLALLLCVWSILEMGIRNFNAQPEVKKNAVFVYSGPYRLIRNPMYAGLIIFFGTGTISNFSWSATTVFTLLLVIFMIKIRLEEKYLLMQFGDQYRTFKEKTWRLIPFLF